MKPILDMCCGSRMFWFDKADDRAVFGDILALTDVRPTFGHTSGKQANTHWICFLKPEGFNP